MSRVVAVLPMLLAGGASADDRGDALRGRELVETRCVACHSLDAHRIGPALGGVFGRPAGSQPGYAYSAALAAGGPVWTALRLRTWLADPQALIPGTAMAYRLEEARDRADVAAFLASLASTPTPTPTR